MVLRFAVLGPLTISRDTGPQPLGATMQRRLLAALLCHSGQPVSTAALTEALWGATPPARPQGALQVYVHRLRRVLDRQSRLTHYPGSYLLQVDRDELDSHLFVDAIHRARAAVAGGSWTQACTQYEQALRLWRGPAYADVSDVRVVEDEAGRLDEQHLHTKEQHLELLLQLGRHPEVIAELRILAELHPFRESLRRLLMLALYLTGRQAEALDTYGRTRALLVGQLGVEPGAPLQRLHLDILRGAPLTGLAAPATLETRATTAAAAPPPAVAAGTTCTVTAGTATAVGPMPPTASIDSTDSLPPVRTPALLPPNVYRYANRSAPLAELNRLLTPLDRATSMPIVVVSGPPGVGKSALTIHWAHRIAGRFPGGQLYIDLRGDDPNKPPLSPEQAVRSFLDVLMVTPKRLPRDLTGRVNLYRTLISGRRMLVVLDNARSTEQVRPLLPGSAGCLVAVTSRHYLLPLIADQGAHSVTLGPMSDLEAYDLLRQRLSAARLATERVATMKIIEACGGLPQALAAVAAHAATNQGVSLRRIAAELDGLGWHRDRHWPASDGYPRGGLPTPEATHPVQADILARH